MALGSYLPPGLMLSTAGVISGTPAASGQFNLNVAVTDGTQTATGEFNLSIYPAGQTHPVSQTQPSNLGAWSIGHLEIPLSATGGNGTYAWSVVGGTLPPGLSLRDDPPPWNQATTAIGGVATTPGTYTFTLRATSGTAFADQITTLTITALSVKDGNAFSYLPDAFVGAPYSYTLTALGAAGPVTFSSPGGLPPGLALGAGGVISGSPATEGYYWISFAVSDGVDTIWRGVSLAVNTVNIATPGVLPNATRGAAYTATLTASGGTPPYSFHDGCCVPGLVMGLDGTISGTVLSSAPLVPARVRVEVTDANMHTFTKWMSIDVLGNAPAPPLPDAASCKNGDALDDCTIGVICSRGVAVVGGGTAPYTWSATGLPPGLSIRPATGSQNEWVATAVDWSANPTAGELEIWGVPMATGTFTMEVTVTDANGAATTQIYPLKVAALIQQVGLPDATLDEPYARKLRVLGGTLPYTAVLSSGELPAGLTFDPASLIVSGVPVESGAFSPVFTFTDAGGADVRSANSISVFPKNPGITIYGVNTFANNKLGAAPIGSPFWYQFAACCAASYQWSIGGGTVPPGLALNSDGVLSGTPTAPGTYTFLVRVEDPNAAIYGQRQFTLSVVTSLLQITGTSMLSRAFVGHPYIGMLTATGGDAPLTWTRALFNLPPPGLTLGTDGVLSGTPQEAGRFAFAVTVTDGTQTTAATMLLTVSDATVTSITVTPGTAALNPGQAQCFIATRLLSDGSTQSTDPNCATTIGMDPTTWSSTNPAVVTVDQNGLAIAHAPGQADIVAASGAISCQTTGSCATVTIMSPAIVTSLSIAPAAGVFSGDVTLSATLTASGAPLAGQIITFALNGNAVGAAATDASGVAPLSGVSLAGIDVGIYPGALSAAFAGNGAFLPAAAASDLTVAGPPAITITSPTEPIYERGSTVLAAYSCGTAATCIGDVANGAPIDTSTPGFKSFQIVATDAFANMTTAYVTYAVSLGSPLSPIAGLSAWLPGDGSARDLVSGTQAAWSGSEAYAAGKAAQAFSLDGMSTVSLPLAQPGPFTLQSWIRVPNRLQPEFTGIISSGAPGQSADTFQLELDGSGNLRLNVGNNDLSVLIGPAADFFQHVAVTFDGTWISVYLNGQLVERDMWTPALGFHVLNIGIDRDALWPFAGLVDEVHVFSRALSDDEVLQTFLAGASGFRKNHAPVAAATATPNAAEATAANGAIVMLDGNGSTDADGDSLTYTWSEGAIALGTGATLAVQLSMGSHAIALTVDDGHDTASTGITVTVQDTTPPLVAVTSPSADAMLTAPTADVTVQVSDVVGASAVLVNGVAATRTNGTAQAGTWRATVPSAPGNALTIGVSVADAAGNTGTAMKVVDNDGIPSIAPAALDRNRTTGADQAGVFSGDFNNGVTTGTLMRNGWTAKVSNAPTPNGVRVQVSGASAVPARVLACVGAAKEVRLDVVGETADVTCDPVTGTITVKAVSASPKVEVWKQTSPTTWTIAQLPTGAVYSTGSPATAAATNTAPITVNIVQADSTGAPTVVVGEFDLAPGASVDVHGVPASGGREHMEFRVLRGTIPVRIGGRTHSLKAGSVTTLTIDRAVPARPVR
ncbi:MAG: hypothetical protein DMF88_07630 [Acidobacteria bacterium]|nr:MAG: hypothetical protein DMF88_07630 [Acidobacteriota bacterium]